VNQRIGVDVIGTADTDHPVVLYFLLFRKDTIMDDVQKVLEDQRTPFVQLHLLLEKFPMQDEEWRATAKTVPCSFYPRNTGPGHVSGRCVFREERPFQYR